jgi:hypothetical protein
METQTKMILEHLKEFKSITALEALSEFRCFRLAARIKNLRDEGHHIHTEMVELPRGGQRIAEYTLIKLAGQHD